MLKSESWLTVPPPKEKVFVRCPGRDSIFGRESFLRVTILPTSGKLPISMPPMLMPMPSHFLMQTQTRKTMHLNFT